MSTIFSKIIAGEIPSYRVWEDEHHFAFLDINPVQPGHTLVVPKAEVDYLFNMDEGAYAALWQAVRTVEAKLRKATDANRVVIDVVGYEVPHVHVHLVPTQTLADSLHSVVTSFKRPSEAAMSSSKRSPSIRISIGCVSGSPNLQLNSSTFATPSFIISPA